MGEGGGWGGGSKRENPLSQVPPKKNSLHRFPKQTRYNEDHTIYTILFTL